MRVEGHGEEEGFQGGRGLSLARGEYADGDVGATLTVSDAATMYKPLAEQSKADSHLGTSWKPPVEQRSHHTLGLQAQPHDRDKSKQWRRCFHQTCRGTKISPEVENAQQRLQVPTNLERPPHVRERAVDSQIKLIPPLPCESLEARTGEPLRHILDFVVREVSQARNLEKRF